MRTASRHTRRSSRAAFWLTVLSAGVLGGTSVASASSPGLPGNADPNLTSLTFTPHGGIWTQTETSRNACPPDCSHDNILHPPGRTDAYDAPRYAQVHRSGTIVWAPGTNGYWVVSLRGEIYARGGAPELCGGRLSSCSGFSAGDYSNITAAAADPQGRGLWAVGRDGKVWTASINANNPLPSFGDAQDSGGAATGIAAAPDGTGYCISISDGGVYCRQQNDHSGSGLFHGAHPDTSDDITGIAFYVDASQKVRGYWLLAKDGGVFSYDAPFLGSTGGNSTPFVTNLVAYPLPGAKPGQEESSDETVGYAWINQNGDITVCDTNGCRSPSQYLRHR